MKLGTPYLKSVFTFLLSVICCANLFSQKNDVPVKDKSRTFIPLHKTLTFPVSCEPLSVPSCNYIQNNNFHPGSVSDDPFTLDILPPWQTGSGSCTVYPGMNATQLAPPAPATSYVFGYAGYYDFINQYASESIVQKIAPVIPGHTYVLSFFISHRDFSDNPYIGVDYPLDHFNIHLINCDDYNATFTPGSWTYPPVPANSQQIYCQDNVANHAWQRVYVHFVAQQPNLSGPLNMIWIWPQGDPDPLKQSGMFVALPELIDISNYATQVQQATSPNCIATLPGCGPAGSVFNWTGPGGSPVISSPTGTPVTVDASNPANVGIWTLNLTVPGANITTSACNTTGSFTTTVHVTACDQGNWPKAYGTGDGPGRLLKDNKGNIIWSSSGVYNSSTFYNHIGVVPGPLEDQSATFQYTSAGITNWTRQFDVPVFAFNSGVVEMLGYDLGSGAPVSFIDGTTGNSVAAPVSISPSEAIIAETNNGTVITRLNNQLNIYSPSGNSTVSVSTFGWQCKFNPATNNLVVIISGLLNPSVNIYHFNGVGFDPPQSYALPYSWWNTLFVQVDNHDRYYFVEIPSYGSSDYVLKQFDYTTGLITTVNISGFNNQFLWPIGCSNPYTADQCIINNVSDNYIYALDLSTTPGSKKILTTNTAWSYAIDGDDLYIVGINGGGTPVTIGNQYVPVVNQNYAVPAFIAKLSLQGDFSKHSGKMSSKLVSNEPFKIALSPNPANQNLTIQVLDKEKLNFGNYTLTISDRMGKIMIKQNNAQVSNKINIVGWEKGIYYIEMMNSKGVKAGSSFLKL